MLNPPMPFEPPTLPRRRWFLLGISPLPLYLLAIVLAVFVHGQLAPGGAKAEVPVGVLLLGTLLSYLLLLGLVLGHRHLLPPTRGLGWQRCLLWVLGLLLLHSAIGHALTAVMDPEGRAFDDYARIFRALFSSVPMPLVLLFIVAVGPWFEELAYRKWMLSTLPQAIGLPMAVLLSSACFVLLHGPGSLWQVLGLASLALLLSLLWLRTRSLAACWLLHASNNALASWELLSTTAASP